MGGKWPAVYSFLLLVVIAVIYTTPWDNYLVATRVWWYDPALVLGLTLGWVPLEEYLFFILQPILVGLWMLILTPRISPAADEKENSSTTRRRGTIMLGIFWLVSILLLVAGEISATYISLEAAWALPAIILQVAFGGDILWRNRKLILFTLVPLTLYLSLADALAIQAGIWTINPDNSLNILLAGVLPVEEFLFFLLTNTLVAFGFVLIWSPESYARLNRVWQRLTLRNKSATSGGESLADAPVSFKLTGESD